MFGTFPATDTVANDSQSPEARAATVNQEPVEPVEKQVEQSAANETSEDSTESSQTQTDELGDDNSEQPDSEKNRGRRGFERRIQKFNQKLQAKDAEIEYWRTQAFSANKPAPTMPQAEATGKPRFEDYNDVEAFTDALTDWKLNQGLSQVRAQTEQQTRVQSYNQRVEQFRSTTPDFDHVLNDFVVEYGDDVIPEIVNVAMESEVGPQIAYYLAKNTHEVDRLAALPAHRRLIELGKIEGSLQKSQRSVPAIEKTKVSRAAPPVEPVKGSGRVETMDLADPNLSYTEWVRRRQAQLKKR